MTTVWENLDLEAKDERYPHVKEALKVEIGGLGVGKNSSLASYLGRQLSALVRRDGGHEIEGAFLSNQSVTALTFADAHGQTITSSATGTPFDLSLFRLR